MKGIQKPFLYVGMAGTCTAFHIEDGDLLSINYLHEGKPKIWYVVPAAEGWKLVQLVRRYTSEYCSLFIRHKSIMIPPSMLKKRGIKFARVS